MNLKAITLSLLTVPLLISTLAEASLKRPYSERDEPGTPQFPNTPLSTNTPVPKMGPRLPTSIEIRDLKSANDFTSSIINNKIPSCPSVKVRINIPYNAEPISDYTYPKTFFDALEKIQITDFEFVICECRSNQYPRNLISEIIRKQPSIETLRMSCLHEGLEKFDLIETNKSIAALPKLKKLYHCSDGNDDGTFFLEKLASHPSLEEVYMYMFADSPYMASQLYFVLCRNKTLKKLAIDPCGKPGHEHDDECYTLDDSSAFLISEGIKTNRTLTDLDLSQHNYSNNSIIYFVGALTQNRNLKINLEGNNFTKEGKQSLMNAIPNSSQRVLLGEDEEDT